MSNGGATVQNDVTISQNFKPRITIWFSNATCGIHPKEVNAALPQVSVSPRSQWQRSQQPKGGSSPDVPTSQNQKVGDVGFVLRLSDFRVYSFKHHYGKPNNIHLKIVLRVFSGAQNTWYKLLEAGKVDFPKCCWRSVLLDRGVTPCAPPPHGHLAKPGHSFGCQNCDCYIMHLYLMGRYQRCYLNILQCAGQPPSLQQRMICFNMSTEPRLANFGVEYALRPSFMEFHYNLFW